MERHYELGIEFANKKDQQDELYSVRENFYIKEDEIYMDGNSLGLASKPAEKELLKMMEEWKEKAIGLWDGYFHFGLELGALMAPLVNASENEIIVTGSTTSNIHSVISTFYHPTKDRYKILVDDINFPTDRYAVDSQVRLKGYEPEDAVKVVKSRDGRYINEDDIIEAMTDDICVILLPTVLYRSAQIVDMKKITKAAHEKGIYIGWDLCHAIGAVQFDFQEVDPDFAIWCTYKYLNGGPGAVASLYINQKHFDKLPGIAGWWGNRDDTQFALKHAFEHQKDASGWQVGTPSMFSMAPLKGTLELYQQVGMDKIRAKSLDLTAYLMYLIDERLSQYGFSIGNPREDAKRGGHVCLEHEEAYRICQSLRRNNVIPDFREPNVIRLAPIAFYTSFAEIHKVVDIIEDIYVNKKYEEFSNTRGLVV